MSKTNILIVEDESIVAKDIAQSLKKLGYNVIETASSGEAAVIIAEEKKPDLVLMDIMLKGEMSGIDAANIIHEKSNIPVIFLTAYADESTLQVLNEPDRKARDKSYMWCVAGGIKERFCYVY